jgi:transcriptional regulator PpsR
LLTRKHSIEGKTAFGDSADFFASLDAEGARRLAMVAGDIALILDASGRIIDGSAHRDDFPDLADWIGKDWVDTVTVESKAKIMEMLAGARKGQTQHWRQVNHIGADCELPVRYVVVPGTGKDFHIAFGRDLRETAALQQRLLQAQQSLERDYMRMRRIEARYRMLFELSSEPVLIVAADGFRIKEANPAAHKMLGAKPGTLEGSKFLSLVSRSDRDALVAYFGSALTTGSVSPFPMKPATGGEIRVSAIGLRQRGGQFLMLRLASDDLPEAPERSAALEVIEVMPDAFVLTDVDRTIITANGAFVELVEVASIDQIRGKALGEFVGRPGIDLELIDGQIAKHGYARNVSTVVGARNTSGGEQVELSVVQTEGPEAYLGFVIRPIARRLRALAPVTPDSPRSVEQLTELVGRMSLKDIVRESTDLIERLCIEAALSYTSDNRASAAEILGLSRQSLYSKLHRYGLGNLVEEAD